VKVRVKEDPQVSARQRPLVIGLALVLVALGGCGTGQVTQTARQQASVNGASGQAGPIAVRDAEFPWPHDEQHLYPRGASVALKLTIVNTGDTPDRLAAVQTEAAGSVRLSGQTAIPAESSVRAVAHPVTEPHGEQPTTAPTTAAPTTTGPGATTTAPGSPTTTPAPGSPTTSAEPTTTAPAPPTTTAEPTTSAPELSRGELSIVLIGLTEDIKPGRTVRVVLLFEQAGEVVLEVPVAAPTEPRGESEH
jgi:copper(I)-binding protein